MASGRGPHRGAAAILILLAATACKNPLIEAMRTQITDDVALIREGDPPLVLASSPAPETTDAATSAAMTLTFDRVVDPATINPETIKLYLMPDALAVEGTVGYDAASLTASFTPSSRLEPDRDYRIEAGTGIRTPEGAALRLPFQLDFRTRYFHDDEIGIELGYASVDLVLSAGAPIYLQLYRVPLPYPLGPGDMALLGTMPLSATGKYRIPSSMIPGGATQAIAFMFHDIDGNYAPGDDGPGNGDAKRVVKTGVAGNLVDEDASTDLIERSDGLPLVVDGHYVLNPAYVLSLGQGYAVTFTDGSPIPQDDYEGSDGSPSTYLALEQGQANSSRTLHSLDDVDFFRFTPAATDSYEIRVESDYPFQIEARLLQANGSTVIESSGSGGWTLNPGGTSLVGGQTYHIRLWSPESGLGTYSISYCFAPAPADQYEGDDLPAAATPLAPGRANAQTHSFHLEGGVDYDWYAIHLDAGSSYAVEIRERPALFGPSAEARGMALEYRLEGSNGGSTSAIYPLAPGGGDLLIADNAAYLGSGTYYLGIGNATATVGAGRPTMGYEISLVLGPDDADTVDDPRSSGMDEYAEWNEHGPNGVSGTATAIPPAVAGTAGARRTIYSTNPAESPKDDVDWFLIQSHNNFCDYLIRTESEPGAEGIIVEFDVYRAKEVNGHILPDLTAGIQGSGQAWSGSQDEPARGLVVKAYEIYGYDGAHTTYYPTLLQGAMFVRVRRSATSASNPLTGAYRLYFRAGADNEDNSSPDTYETVASVQYRLDETPWIGMPNFTDFSDRNKLAIASEWSSGSSPIRYSSVGLKDYDLGTGEPDGSAPGADWDFFWVEIPAGVGNVYLYVIGSIENQVAGMPIKATLYKAPNTSSTTAIDTIRDRDANSDKVVTAGELVAVGTYDSQSYFGSNGNHQIVEQLTFTGGDVIFIRVERDDAHAVTGDPSTGEYYVRVMQW